MIKGKLYICPTPLGNLEDITLRVLRVLGQVDVIAAEDTRHTRKLLAHYSISTGLVPHHQHSSPGQVARLVERMVAGEQVALVTDAGTPGISDPGQALVAECVKKEIEVDPLPGPSAATTALSASGFPLAAFTYQGFLPRKGLDRAVQALTAIEHPVVLYESPRRILRMLESIGKYMPTREVLLARELTKVHQQLLRGKSNELQQLLQERGLDRGEFTVVLGPWSRQEVAPQEGEIIAEVEKLTGQGLSTRDAITQVSSRHGVSRRWLYNLVNKKMRD